MPPAADTPAVRPLAWACAAFAGGVLLHIDRVPPWASAAALGLIAGRLLSARTSAWLPGTALRALLALMLTGIVLVRFHTLNGLAAGTALLMLMAALKLLETRTARDQLVMIGTALFLLLAACLDRQGLVRTPLYALEAWLCCAALAAIASPTLPVRAAWRLAGRTLLLATPLALALFVFFPRVAGSFWAIPRGGEAQTGLADSMSPGSIVRLIANYDPAFRVKFAGALPPREELYWRGPVLHDFDGHTWRRAEAWRPRQSLEYLGTAVHYRVALEPSHRRWWIALDLPARSPAARVFLSYDNQLIASDRVSEPVSYDAVSYTRARAREPLSAGARREDTALPPAANPRSAALAHSLRARAGSDAAFVSATLEYLRTGGFAYSLTPEPLGRDAIDDFLFQTREGFCGHYASAFVTLMRAADVPARVVTGYLGGEWNLIGNYFVVRQSDAHAWAEVWLEGRGWTRVDPTGVVAPERLRRGMFDFMPDAYSAPERLLHATPWMRDLLQRWDAANAWWSERVVKFDYSTQLNLLERLGIRSPDTRHLGWAFMLALLGWLALLAWHVSRSARAAPADALARAYLRLCRKLERAGTARAPHQGPLALAQAVGAQRPDLTHSVQGLLERYARLRYGPPIADAADAAREFARAVARLSLPRTRTSGGFRRT